MTYYIIVENGEQGRYTAHALGWPELIVQGTTRQEVLARIRRQISARLQQVEIVPMEIDAAPATEHPWMKFAGVFQDDPLFDRVMGDHEPTFADDHEWADLSSWAQQGQRVPSLTLDEELARTQWVQANWASIRLPDEQALEIATANWLAEENLDL